MLPKKLKLVALLETKQKVFRPSRELKISLSFFTVLTGQKYSGAWKNSYIEKKDLKLTKNRPYGYGNLTTCRKLHLFL